MSETKLHLQKFKIYSLMFWKFILIQHGLQFLQTFTFILPEKKSFSHFGAKVWNEIPQSIKKLPKKIFKKTKHTKLLELLCQEDAYF